MRYILICPQTTILSGAERRRLTGNYIVVISRWSLRSKICELALKQCSIVSPIMSSQGFLFVGYSDLSVCAEPSQAKPSHAMQCHSDFLSHYHFNLTEAAPRGTVMDYLLISLLQGRETSRRPLPPPILYHLTEILLLDVKTTITETLR